MVATTTVTSNGLSVKVADSDFTLVSILSDLDMRTGTPVGSEEWLKGFGSTYPGGSDMSTFSASNSDGAAEGSLRMVTITANVVQAATVEPLLFSAGASKIVGILGAVGKLAAKDVTVYSTETGLVGANDTVAPLATTGALPCLVIDSEGANNVIQVTVLLLN